MTAGQNSSPIAAIGAPEEAECCSISMVCEVRGSVSTINTPHGAARPGCMTNHCANFLPNKAT